MNSNIKLIIMILIFFSCETKPNVDKEIFKHSALNCLSSLEGCSLVSNKVFDNQKAKVIFCFNGNCSICFYKCIQFDSLFQKILEKKGIQVFYTFISDFKDEAIVNFSRTKINQPIFYDVNNVFTKSNNIDVLLEPKTLLTDNKGNVFLFSNLLNSPFERKHLMKIIDAIE